MTAAGILAGAMISISKYRFHRGGRRSWGPLVRLSLGVLIATQTSNYGILWSNMIAIAVVASVPIVVTSTGLIDSMRMTARSTS